MNKRTVLITVEASLVPENETNPGKKGIIEHSDSGSVVEEIFPRLCIDYRALMKNF